jgi:hypothetical protein
LGLNVQKATAPPGPISAGLSGGHVVLTSPGSATLQSATNLVNGFGDITGATSPYTNSVTSAPQMFFRLRN